MRPRWRLRLLAPVLAAGLLAVAATPAAALDCAQFKAAVESATDGAVITLDAGLHCNDAYNLPSAVNPLRLTIQGAGAGATLDGSSHPGEGILNGFPTVGGQIHATIRRLTFKNGSSS